MSTITKVNQFFEKTGKWQAEYQALRKLVLDCGLYEDYKWMHPCYTFEGKNIVLIHGFKEYCALLFHKGVLLKDDKGILVQQTENVQAARQIRFTALSDIHQHKTTIKSYILEAIQLEKAGATVEMKKTAEYPVPGEFLLVLKDMPELEKAFNALTPGRQRGYLLYFSAPKQSKTRESRIEKNLQKIFDGKGLED
jgi:uncharacterized protein YdeI (YjbR/CyaY-like superfamily)